MSVFLSSESDPGDAGSAVDDQEESEEDDGENIADDDEECYSGYAVGYPVEPGVYLAIDKPVVGKDGRSDQESVEELDSHMIGERIVLEHIGAQQVISSNDKCRNQQGDASLAG